jgi:hypothetical protein
MRRTVELLARTLANQELVSDTGKDVLRVITDYAYALTLLDRYDHGTLTIEGITKKALHVIDYGEGIHIVNSMKGEFDGLFGIEPGIQERSGGYIPNFWWRGAVP